jgi:hypothetical protein
VREAAIEALVTALDAEASIKLVKRVDSETALSSQALPAVLVVDDGGEVIHYKTGGLADVYFSVRLIGVVRDRVNLSQAMNTLDVTIKKAVVADTTLGGAVAHITIEPLEDKSLDDTDSVAKFTRPVRMFYEASVAGGL